MILQSWILNTFAITFTYGFKGLAVLNKHFPENSYSKIDNNNRNYTLIR